MNTKLTIAALALGAGALFVTGQNALAYRGDTSVQGPNHTPERHEAMMQAFENQDYNAWKELMGEKGRVTEVVTEQNFNRFAQMHLRRLEGDTEGANQIREELGLGMRNGSGHGQGQRGGQGYGNSR